MNKIFTSILLLTAFQANAQWNNTSNQFTDSLYMPVCSATGDQTNVMSMISYPDKGTIVFWQDKRAGFYANGQIFAQKFDKDGKRLWPQDGIPVSIGTNNQHFAWSSNQDYRNRKVAATDSAGGFYLTYLDDSIATYAWYRVCVQHIKSDGSLTFPGAGAIIAQPTPANGDNYASPQLIADESKGFYISYIQNKGNDNIYVYCFKEESGILKNLGGGLVNYNAVQDQTGLICPSGAVRKFITYPGTTVIDYNIWPDLQGGCSVIMSLNGNTGSQYKMLAYNRVWKAKKNAAVSVATYFPSGGADTRAINYAKGDVDILYKYQNLLLDRNCTDPATGYKAWVDDILISNGYLLLDQGGYDYNYPKGVAIPTPGNINVELIAVTRRSYDGNTVSNFIVSGIGRSIEIYDSVPFERASNGNPLLGFNPIAPPEINKVNNFRDTLIGEGRYYYDFSLAGGGNQFYASALTWENDGSGSNERKVRLQQLNLERQTADSFAIHFSTPSNKGVIVGREVSTGFTGTDISYDIPLVTANKTGNAVFYINEIGRSPRVSPIEPGAKLSWGAMGKPIGSGILNGNYYSPTAPFVALDESNGTGVISWQDEKNIPLNSRINISMRHLDQLNVADYLPPNNKLKIITNPYGATIARPAVFTGISKKMSIIEAYSSYGADPGTSPIIGMLDDYNLGNIQASVFENTGAIRKYNGKPYLDRNYTIKPENNPNGAATIQLRLFFTTAEFDALKAAEPSITDPGSLVVLKQPNATATAPSAYALAGGEELITPTAWAAVDGGYYVEIQVSKFSNFYIEAVNGALPVTWLGVQAQWINSDEAKVSWQIAQQLNVKGYTVQRSDDAINFTDACTVEASSATDYYCNLPANNQTKNYYRIAEKDIDGKIGYSKIVLLQARENTVLTTYPNPAKNQLNFSGLPVGNYTIEISTANGKLVKKQNASAGQTRIDISELNAGVYLLTIKSSGKRQTVKFVKN